jgi:hypothetical protein
MYLLSNFLIIRKAVLTVPEVLRFFSDLKLKSAIWFFKRVENKCHAHLKTKQ